MWARTIQQQRSEVKGEETRRPGLAGCAGGWWCRPHTPAQAAAVLRAVVLLPSAADSPRVSPRVSGAQATDTPAPMRVMTAAMIIVGPMPMCDRAWGTR